jgi:hypothetical protein
VRSATGLQACQTGLISIIRLGGGMPHIPGASLLRREILSGNWSAIRS